MKKKSTLMLICSLFALSIFSQSDVESKITYPDFINGCNNGEIDLIFNGAYPPFEVVWYLKFPEGVNDHEGFGKEIQSAFGIMGLNDGEDLAKLANGKYRVEIKDALCGHLQLNFVLDADNACMGSKKSEDLTKGIVNYSLEKEALVSCYPNPSNGLFTIAVDNFLNAVNVVVYKLDGTRIFNAIFKTDKFELDLKDQESGIYVIHIRGEHLDYRDRIFLID